MANTARSLRTSLLYFAVPLALTAVLQLPLTAQQSAAKASLRPVSEPDLQGVWTNVTITPLERPRDLGSKASFTKAEAEAYEKKVAHDNDKDRRDGSATADVARAYNEAWWDRGTHVVSSLRTSLVVEPADGRIPALTPAARAAAQERAKILARAPWGPEDRGIQERCIAGSNVGPPWTPTVYNNNVQIFQSPGVVVIENEMVHDFRVVRTDGSPHLPSNFRFWLGDPRGHWEGKTLVVDTTNFNNEAHFRGADENLHVIERFTRTKPNEILYQFRIEDPTAFVSPWAGEMPLQATEGPIYEYACHEGNYGLAGQLSGARAEEKKAAEAAAKKSQ